MGEPVPFPTHEEIKQLRRPYEDIVARFKDIQDEEEASMGAASDESDIASDSSTAPANAASASANSRNAQELREPLI